MSLFSRDWIISSPPTAISRSPSGLGWRAWVSPFPARRSSSWPPSTPQPMPALTFGSSWSAASAGAIVGDNLGYWLGGRFGYPLLLRFDEDLDEALGGPPIEHLERGYSLEEIRFNHELRDRMRRIDLDTINFEFGAWDVAPDQYPILERIAAAINRIIDRNPEEVFMIEGYTDAVGSDIDNLSLSDHRAQSVAEILTDDFNVPPENLVTQGYGKEYLKIPTNGPERANRRVAIRRITPLLSQGDDR